MDIFLAAPLTDRVDPNTHLIEASYRAWLETIIEELECRGHSIINAHSREKWGANLYPPGLALQKDLSSIRDSDLLIAYLGMPLSPGVQMELGFALAFKKPIILIHEDESSVPYLVKGIIESNLVSSSEIVFSNQDELIEKLTREVEIMLGKLDRYKYTDMRERSY